ncbi:hypothetical protein ACFWGN_16160 [Oerskovia sp. NPDC060338]|uniref:hypothetical protein n=1 Tax=Oerskovia sp. NPDC060338 TaxID=3347100 RepID=UPI00365F6789
MAKFKNVSPLGALDLALVGRVVAPGEVVEVSAAQARHLEGQADWQEVLPKRGGRKPSRPDEAGAVGAGDDEGEEQPDGTAE